MSKFFDSIEVSSDIRRFVDHSFAIVDRIHEILGDQGKTQRDLANLLGKKESEISKWMRGTHNFTLKSISKIEDVLGESIIHTLEKPENITVPVTVHSNMNKVLSEKPFSPNVKWKRTKKTPLDEGLKSA